MKLSFMSGLLGLALAAHNKRLPNGNSALASSTSLDASFCVPEATKTVFVTVYPPCPLPEDSSVSAQIHHSVTQFTTITISDLWPQETSTWKVDPVSSAQDQPPAYGGSSELMSSAKGLTTSYSLVTDTSMQWVSHSTGISRVTRLSTRTITMTISPPETGTVASSQVLPTGGPSGTVAEVTDGTNPATACHIYTVVGLDGQTSTLTVTLAGSGPTAQSMFNTQESSSPMSSDSSNGSPSQGSGLTTEASINVIGTDGSITPTIATIVVGSQILVTGAPENTAVATANLPSIFQSIETSVDSLVSLPEYNSNVQNGYSTPIGGESTAAAVTTVDGPPAYGYGLTPSAGNMPPYVQLSTAPGDWASSLLSDSLPTAVPTPSPCNTTMLRTSTWTNVIPESLTTYTLQFPMTTLVTVTVPPLLPFGKKAKRQGPPESGTLSDNTTDFTTKTLVGNTSVQASLSSLLGKTESPSSTLSPTLSPNVTIETVATSTPTPESSLVTSSPVETSVFSSPTANLTSSAVNTSSPVLSWSIPLPPVPIDTSSMEPTSLTTPSSEVPSVTSTPEMTFPSFSIPSNTSEQATETSTPTDWVTQTLSPNSTMLTSMLPISTSTPVETPLTPESTILSVVTSTPTVSPVSITPVPSFTTPNTTTPTSTAQVFPSVCPFGGRVGNTTINFDNLEAGPLLNPTEDLWFSEGFLIAPPSSPPFNPYIPSSGGNMVEFVPPALSSVLHPAGSGDVAEIGVGPNYANPCYKIDLFSANLGCAAEGAEKWCEFEVSAYTHDAASTTESSIAWSEIKRVPACPNFPSGTCSLTPVEFEGYTNITSVLIRLRVGLDLRTWWGDDFKFGWTDNSCEASACRVHGTGRKAKREVIDKAVRDGVWQWTPYGLQKLDTDYIFAASV